MKTFNNNLRFAALTLLLWGVSLTVPLLFPAIRYPAVFLADYFLGISALLIWMSFRLRASLKESLFAYKNVVLIGGLLYFSVQLIVMSASAIPYLFSGEGLSFLRLFSLILSFTERFSYLLAPVLFLISAAVFISNLSLIRHEGFRVTHLLGAILGALFLGGTAVFRLLPRLLESFWADDGSVIFRLSTLTVTYASLFFLMIVSYFECLFLGCVVMGYRTARHVPSFDKDYIIILGCSISKKGGLLPLLKARTNRAIRFAWDQEIATGKKVLYVPSGGQGPDEIMSEGSAIELYLLSHGAETDEVFPERESTNTRENLQNSKEVIDRMCPQAKIAFATTNYHVLRSGMLARISGYEMEGIASQTKWYFWPNGFIREYFGILSLKMRQHRVVAALCAVFCLGSALIAWLAGV